MSLYNFSSQQEKNYQIKTTLADIRRLKNTRASGVFKNDNVLHDRCEWSIANLKRQLTNFRNAEIIPL